MPSSASLRQLNAVNCLKPGQQPASKPNTWRRALGKGLFFFVTCASIVLTGYSQASDNTASHKTAKQKPKAATQKSLTLRWDPRPASEQVLGYRIYFGSSPSTANRLLKVVHIESGKIDPRAPAITLQTGKELPLNAGDTVCFRVKAFNTAGESELSEVDCIKIGPSR